MNKYDTLILNWNRTLEIGSNITIPYGYMFTAELYEENNKTYILVKMIQPVESLGTMFLVKNIIFN